MLCMLMIVFLFIVRLTLSSIIVRLTLSSIIMRLTLSSLLWGLPSLPLLWGLLYLHYYEAYHLFHYYEAYLLFHYYEAYPLFVNVFMLYALQFKLYTPILCKSCFLTQYSYSLQIMFFSSILIFIANHASFKYYKPINMKSHHPSLMLVIVFCFLFIVRLTLSLLLWGLPSLLYYEVYPLFHYYEPYALFVIMRLTLSSLMCSCFMLYNSNSILLFFTNRTFFKYDKPINMKFHHYFLHNLYPNCSTYSDTLNQFKTFHSCIIS
jgi:hypothetical protein